MQSQYLVVLKESGKEKNTLHTDDMAEAAKRVEAFVAKSSKRRGIIFEKGEPGSQSFDHTGWHVD